MRNRSMTTMVQPIFNAAQMLLTASLTLSANAFADPVSENPGFFANGLVQRLYPEAFVLQPEAEGFLRSFGPETQELRDDLVKAIIQVPHLYQAIQVWETLSFDEQVPYLELVFDLQTKLMKIKPPELLFDAKAIPGRAAFFDFSVEKSDPGRVILNPQVLKTMDAYASLALLIHETRHSAQLQLAFASKTEQPFPSPAARAYQAAFHAQKTVTEIQSFCDFLTLANEFEAFQFGNFVLGRLTAWRVDMPDMGTFASQYDTSGRLKTDLVRLLDNGDPSSLLDKFNTEQVEQCKLLGICQR